MGVFTCEIVGVISIVLIDSLTSWTSTSVGVDSTDGIMVIIGVRVGILVGIRVGLGDKGLFVGTLVGGITFSTALVGVLELELEPEKPPHITIPA